MKPFVSASEIVDHIDPKKQVDVYRNLHKNCFSIRQGGIVKCHAKEIPLILVEFRVGKKGRERVISEKRKNVHAFVRGNVSAFADDIVSFLERSPYVGHSRYNPYENEQFVLVRDEPFGKTYEPIKLAAQAFCYFSSTGKAEVAVYGTVV